MRSAIYQSADGTTAVWDGERVSTAFVETTVNTVVGKGTGHSALQIAEADRRWRE